MRYTYTAIGLKHELYLVVSRRRNVRKKPLNFLPLLRQIRGIPLGAHAVSIQRLRIKELSRGHHACAPIGIAIPKTAKENLNTKISIVQ